MVLEGVRLSWTRDQQAEFWKARMAVSATLIVVNVDIQRWPQAARPRTATSHVAWLISLLGFIWPSMDNNILEIVQFVFERLEFSVQRLDTTVKFGSYALIVTLPKGARIGPGTCTSFRVKMYCIVMLVNACPHTDARTHMHTYKCTCIRTNAHAHNTLLFQICGAAILPFTRLCNTLCAFCTQADFVVSRKNSKKSSWTSFIRVAACCPLPSCCLNPRRRPPARGKRMT